jgi:hypothetical protein
MLFYRNDVQWIQYPFYLSAPVDGVFTQFSGWVVSSSVVHERIHRDLDNTLAHESVLVAPISQQAREQRYFEHVYWQLQRPCCNLCYGERYSSLLELKD